jgi:O-methyltransferase
VIRFTSLSVVRQNETSPVTRPAHRGIAWFVSRTLRYGFIVIGASLSFTFSRGAQGPLRRLLLAISVLRNSTRLGSATNYVEQLELVKAVLAIPPNLLGDVAEFGCYKGFSSSSLSLACRAVGRRLFVFDSFEGLPDRGEVRAILNGDLLKYKRGDFTGTLDEVRSNIAKYGDLQSCVLVAGFFDETLPRLSDERFVLIFEDADLPSSVRSVLRWAWPRLQPGCLFYTHEARDLEVVKLFFNDELWSSLHGEAAPGIVGSGSGLMLLPSGSCLAYVRRRG